jgi:hypothetical protein
VKSKFKESLSHRILPGGGFSGLPKGEFRVDATAWGILFLRAVGESSEFLELGRARLRTEQSDDGRVAVSGHHPDSYWPTPLAILAWQDSPASTDAQRRAVQFLLGVAGTHPPRKADDPVGHNTALKGWPWIAGTHSWVEPTALCLMALLAAGQGQHERVNEAFHMLLDRQLPHGGWNVGNTLVFGRELHPNPEATGAALAALAGATTRERVSQSIEYLHDEIDRLRTPVSLGWALWGLGAWNLWPSNGVALVERCLANQTRYGAYDTSVLCLLFLGALAGEVAEPIALPIPSNSGRSSPGGVH